jgi:hypothetical protein
MAAAGSTSVNLGRADLARRAGRLPRARAVGLDIAPASSRRAACLDAVYRADAAAGGLRASRASRCTTGVTSSGVRASPASVSKVSKLVSVYRASTPWSIALGFGRPSLDQPSDEGRYERGQRLGRV